MDFADAILSNLLSPAVLFFVLGVFAAVTRSDLKFPESLYTTLTIYLLTAIGFKGGVAIHEAGLGAVWLPGTGVIKSSRMTEVATCSWAGRRFPACHCWPMDSMSGQMTW